MAGDGGGKVPTIAVTAMPTAHTADNARYVARFDYRPANTDELAFRVGDVVVVTKQVEGGWWEGYLATADSSDSGWFPSNHVSPCTDGDGEEAAAAQLTPRIDKTASVLAFRDFVVKQIVEAEREYVDQLQDGQDKILKPLAKAEWLGEDETRLLVAPLTQLIECQKVVQAAVAGQGSLSAAEERMGACFLSQAPRLLQAYCEYAASHPAAVATLGNLLNGAVPDEARGLLTGTAGRPSLSSMLQLPLGRLDHYSHALQELEKHTANDHPDIGALQKVVQIFDHMANAPARIRALKSSEYGLLHEDITGAFGPPLAELGELQLITSAEHVSGTCDNTPSERSEALILLFAENVVVLAKTKAPSDETPTTYAMVLNAPIKSLNMHVEDYRDQERAPVSLTMESEYEAYQWECVFVASSRRDEVALGSENGFRLYEASRFFIEKTRDEKEDSPPSSRKWLFSSTKGKDKEEASPKNKRRSKSVSISPLSRRRRGSKGGLEVGAPVGMRKQSSSGSGLALRKLSVTEIDVHHQVDEDAVTEFSVISAYGRALGAPPRDVGTRRSVRATSSSASSSSTLQAQVQGLMLEVAALKAQLQQGS